MTQGIRKTIRPVAGLLLGLLLTASTAFAAGERLALVSSEEENSVAVLDLLTEKTVKVLPVGKTPHAMAATATGKIFVNNRGSADLTVLDANTLEVTATIALPAISFQLALSPDGGTLAVVYKNALTLTLVDAATNEIIRAVEIGEMPAENFKAAMMKHPYWSPDGKNIYCPESVRQTIVKVDAAKGEVVKRIALTGATHYLHASPDGKLLYAVNETTKDGASLTLIDAASDTVVADLPIPLGPGEKGGGHHASFSPDNRYYFFSNLGGSGLHVLDVAARAWIKVIPTGKGPGHPAISRDGKYIFVVHHKDGVISVIDVARQEHVKDIRIGNGNAQAHAAYFTPDNKFFYAVASKDNVMAKIDVAKMKLVSTIPVAKTSMFFAIKEGETYPPTE
jgi:YVTN family beta-propeller protein